MRLQIFDVGHGFCAFLVGDSGIKLLFDAGHNDTFRPSFYLPLMGHTGIHQLLITNFDHDHVSDLHDVRSHVSVRSIFRNPSMTAEQIRALKLTGGPLTDGLGAAIDLHASFIAPVPPLDFGTLALRHYWNRYPTFTDTNNLSLVTFVQYDGLSVLIPGDMEGPGWKALLQSNDFQQDLAGTQIVVASHHGRDSGYCEDVFQHCQPDVTVISDDEIQYDSQIHCYAQHCGGLAWSDGSTRRVLTTRSDGHITISKTPGQVGYTIRTRKRCASGVITARLCQ